MGFIWCIGNILLRGLRWCRRLARKLIHICCNRVTLFLLLALLGFDLWCEWRGVPAFLQHRLEKQMEKAGVPFRFSWLQAGVFRGVVLHDVSGEVKTVAGPLQVSIQTLTASVDVFVFLDDEVLPREVTARGASVCFLDEQNERSLEFAEMSLRGRLEGDGSLHVSGDGVCQGLEVTAHVNLGLARDGLIDLLYHGELSDETAVNAAWQRVLKETHNILGKSLPKGSGSKVRLSLSGLFSNVRSWRAEGYVNIRDAKWGKVDISHVFCSFDGTLENLQLPDVRLELGHQDILSGKATFYPENVEVEGAFEGSLTRHTAGVVLDELAVDESDMVRETSERLAGVPFESMWFSCQVERGALSLAGLSATLTCRLPETEYSGLGRGTGEALLVFRDGRLTVEHASLSLKGKDAEQAEFTGCLDLVRREVSGEVHGKVNLRRRLFDLEIELPESLLQLPLSVCDFQMKLSPSPLSLAGLKLAGELKQQDVRIVGMDCNEVRIPFSLNDGTVRLENLQAVHRERGEAVVKASLSCNVVEGLQTGNYMLKVDGCELSGHRLDGKEWGMAVSVNGDVHWSTVTRRLGFEVKGTVFPERLHQSYLRWLDFDRSRMLMHIDCSGGQAMSCHLKMDDYAMNGREPWQIDGELSFGAVVFNGLAFRKAVCPHFEMTSSHCRFNRVSGETLAGDTAVFDLRIDYSPLILTFSDVELQGDPRFAAAFFLNDTLHDRYLQIFSEIQWSKTSRPEIQMPNLRYYGGIPWSVECHGLYVNARDMRYREMEIDELNLVVTLSLPDSITIEPVTIRRGDWRVGGKVEVELEGVPQCRFEIFRTQFGVDLKYILAGLLPDVAAKLDMVSVSGDCLVECAGNLFLVGEPRVCITGKVQASSLACGLQELKDVDADWEYDSGCLRWNVKRGTYFGGAVVSTGSYDIWDDHGEFLLRFRQVLLDDFLKVMIPEANRNKGTMSGECHVRLLHGWAERDCHLVGNGQIHLQGAELWEVPLLSGLGRMLTSAAFGGAAFSIGRISTMDMDVEFTGGRIAIPRMVTNGTIISLSGRGDYRWEDHWQEGQMHFTVDGIPVQDVKLLSFMLRTVAGIFEAELSGTLQDNSWKLRTVLGKLF